MRHAESYYGRGSCYDSLDQPAKALDDYNAAIAISGKYSELWYAKADALFNLGRHDEAVISYRMVLELAPNDYEAWFDYGEALFEMKRIEESRNAYETSISLQPAWSEPHYSLARILFREDNILDAAVELLISFRLEASLIKQYEIEFPMLRVEEAFTALNALVRSQLAEGPKAQAIIF